VGALFALALIILAVTVMAVGETSRLFSKKTSFRVIFPNTDGLSVGSPVKMAGVQVGSVTGIHLPTDPAGTGIEVQMGVDRAYAGRVREDSRAALRILQYLTGEKAVEITPGTPESPELPPGSEIQPGQDTELLEQVGVASQNLSDITVSLKRILGALERGEGLMGKMITDPEFGREGLDALHGTLVNLRQLSEDLLRGRGFVGRLLYDEKIAARLDDLGDAVERMAGLVGSVDLERGAVGEMLRDDGAGRQAVQDLQAAAASLRNVAQRMDGRDSLLGQMLDETDYEGDLAQDLGRVLANLAEITDKINSGEGTLGALVNERTLYEGMEDVAAGVNDSKFARWLLRHYQKKGIKLETAEIEQTRDADTEEP
jgi:phospholipid/cholesterol/gamma-HCH transport system substrate-binding protein